MFTNKDIEVFVLTYNRSEFLKQSVESILNQTAGPVKITVIDNASTDDTKDIVKKMMTKHPNLHYFCQKEHQDCYAKNAKTAQEKAQAKYVIFFHDDDIAHPQYLEMALQLLNKYVNVDLICTLLKNFSDEKEISFPRLNKIQYVYFKNRLDFIAHIYASMFADNTSLCFPSIIYKTENIKNLKMNSDIGGKAFDKPWVLSSLKKGVCLQIRNPEIFNYRIHAGQDTKSTRIDPNTEQIIRHQLFFKKVLEKEKWSRKWFYAFALDWIDLFYDWGNNNPDKKVRKKFYQTAWHYGIIDLIGLLSKKGPFKKVFKKILKKRRKSIAKKIRKIHLMTLNVEHRG